MKRLLVRGILAAAIISIVLFGVIQLVPYGRDHENPPVRLEPEWDSSQTRDLAVRACYACHSNETRWPWYSNIAPVSWFIQRDVNRARRGLNFSEWDRPQKEGQDAAEIVRREVMPPKFKWKRPSFDGTYTWVNRTAKLSDAERAMLAKGLAATLGDRHVKR